MLSVHGRRLYDRRYHLSFQIIHIHKDQTAIVLLHQLCNHFLTGISHRSPVRRSKFSTSSWLFIVFITLEMKLLISNSMPGRAGSSSISR